MFAQAHSYDRVDSRLPGVLPFRSPNHPFTDHPMGPLRGHLPGSTFIPIHPHLSPGIDLSSPAIHQAEGRASYFLAGDILRLPGRSRGAYCGSRVTTTTGPLFTPPPLPSRPTRKHTAYAIPPYGDRTVDPIFLIPLSKISRLCCFFGPFANC